MQRLLPRWPLEPVIQSFLRPQKLVRHLHVLHLPKDGPVSKPISVSFENRDVVYRFVENDAPVETLSFKKEPLGVPAEQGFGYFRYDLGERFGPDSRFEILRKLGFGQNSSVWLAKDFTTGWFIAIKALNGHASSLCKRGMLLEDYILEDISAHRSPGRKNCLTMLARFVIPGKVEEDGEHLCLGTRPMGPNVKRLLHNYSGKKRILLVKKILRDTLLGLQHLHSIGIAHTDLFDRNIMVDLGNGPNSFDIQTFIENEPARKNPPERTWGGKWIQTAVSQPFPEPSYEEAMVRDFVIADFGSAQYVNQQVTDNIMPLDLRAPEVILGLPWNEKVDVWAFGCLAFELIHDQFFISRKLMDKGVSYELATLSQQILFTGDCLPSEAIANHKTIREFLDPDTSWLIGKGEAPKVPFLNHLRKLGYLVEEGDLVGAHDLMRKCLRINPDDRLSVKDLLKDTWLNSSA